MPATLPASVIFFRLRAIQYGSDPTDGLTGAFPTTFFANIGPASTSASYFSMDISYNRISGGFSASMFSAFESRPFSNFELQMYGNKIVGSIPSGLLTPFGSALMSSFSLDVGSTSTINGQLPNNLIPSGIVKAGGSFSFSAGSCSLSGSIPNGFISNLPAGVSINLDFSYNAMTSLPDYISSSSSAPYILALNLQSNLIAGPLNNFLSSSWSSNNTVNGVVVYLQNNLLTGTIPETLLFNYFTAKRYGEVDEESNDDSSLVRSADAADAVASFGGSGILASATFTLYLANNGLTGTIPPLLFASSFAPASTLNNGVTIDFSFNKLNGTIPSTLFDGLPNTMAGTFAVKLNNNMFSGTVPSFCANGPLVGQEPYRTHSNLMDHMQVESSQTE